jgi:ferredoxin--NADP+ reductase
VVVRFLFFRSPVAIHGESKVESIELVRNRLEEQDGRLVAVPTEEHETLECGLVFRSVGYRGVGLSDVPFDEKRGTIHNEGGRVVGAERTYCAGWIKRGPTGIIGTNKKDASETVARLLEDVETGRLEHNPEATPEAVEALLAERDASAVLYAGWTSIDELERAAGEKLGRPRVKLRTWDELLAAADRVAETA